MKKIFIKGFLEQKKKYSFNTGNHFKHEFTDLENYLNAHINIQASCLYFSNFKKISEFLFCVYNENT